MFSILSVAALHEPMPVIMFVELYSKIKIKSQLKRGGHKHREKVRVDCAWLVCEVLYLFLRNLHGMVKYDPTELLPHLA